MSIRCDSSALNLWARSMTPARWRCALARVIGRPKLAWASALPLIVVSHQVWPSWSTMCSLK